MIPLPFFSFCSTSTIDFYFHVRLSILCFFFFLNLVNFVQNKYFSLCLILSIVAFICLQYIVPQFLNYTETHTVTWVTDIFNRFLIFICCFGNGVQWLLTLSWCNIIKIIYNNVFSGVQGINHYLKFLLR